MEWLQFADFHFGKRNSAQQLAMGSLNRFIAENLSQKPGKIDAVLIVGDIAFSGHESEYVAFENDFLKPLLSLSALEGAKVIAVPGNHDVTCDASAPISWDGIKERNQAIVFCETEEGRKFRAQRSSVFSNYQQFVKRNNIMSPDTGEEISCLLTEGTLPFDVLAVNTALFCDKDEESELPIIPCPLDSLRHRILTVQQNRPLIIIGHHPLNNFMREQQRPFESFLIDNKAVYLHGHEHDPKLTSNPDGTVRTLGFGATYLSPLGKKTHSPYCNSFVRCCLDQNLWLNGYSWDDSVGRWQDSTRSQFSSCATQENYDKGAIILNLPVYSKGRDNSIVKTALPDIPRKTPHPQSISPISVPSDKVWLKLLLLSDNVHKHYRNYTEKDEHTCNTSDGKAEFIIEQAQKRNLLVCIPATTHILSAKEIENYNTRLDTEDYRSVTVLSFGKMSGEARDMYLRLKNRKNIECHRALQNQPLMGGSKPASNCVD